MKQPNLIFTVLLVPLDFISILLAGVGAYALRTSTLVTSIRPVLFYLNLPLDRFLGITLMIAVFLIIVFALNGLYDIKRRDFRALDELVRIFIAVSAGFVGIIIYIFFKREWFDSRFIILVGWLFVIANVFFARLLANVIRKFLASRYKTGLNKVLIIGSDKIAEEIAQETDNRPTLGYRVVSRMGDIDLETIKKEVVEKGVEEIILTNLDFSRDQILDLVDLCHEEHLVFKFVPNLFQTLTANATVDTLAGVPIIELKRTALDGWGKVFKRTIDIVGSILGLIILSPLFLVIALLIKLDSPGPVFVKLNRVSQNKEFWLYKFRSMVANAEAMKKELLPYNERGDGPLFKIKCDPRVTRLGSFLRRTRLDEFPQLFNSLGGDMSLIGPRPHQPDEIAQYQKHHKKLLAIKAGISGMAQTSGSSDLPFEEEVKLDTYYIEDWSIGMDLKILLKTILKLFTDKSAC